MSAEILIEGLSPNSILGPGERRRVQATPLVKTLIRNGFARVIHEDAPDITVVFLGAVADEALVTVEVDPPAKRRRRATVTVEVPDPAEP